MKTWTEEKLELKVGDYFYDFAGLKGIYDACQTAMQKVRDEGCTEIVIRWETSWHDPEENRKPIMYFNRPLTPEQIAEKENKAALEKANAELRRAATAEEKRLARENRERELLKVLLRKYPEENV